MGKTTLAVRLAQALNCREEAPPCGQCRSCRRIAGGLHLDVSTIHLEGGDGEGGEERDRPRTGTKNIKLQQVNDLLHSIALSRQEGAYKVFTILGAEYLQIDAANRLLKVLEEPPPRVVLLLTAVDANILLPTIVSRCQTIRLQPVSVATIAQHLRDRLSVEPGRAEVLARLSGGRVGWAIAAATDDSVVAERAESLARLVRLLDAGLGERLAVAGQLATEFGRERERVYAVLDLWTAWWRDVLLVQAGAEELVANYDQIEPLRSQARAGTPRAAHRYVARIEAARSQLGQNVNPRLALESLLLNIPLGRAS